MVGSESNNGGNEGKKKCRGNEMCSDAVSAENMRGD